MTFDDAVATRFGEMRWFDLRGWPGWKVLRFAHVDWSNDHIAAVHAARGEIIVFFPAANSPGGPDQSLCTSRSGDSEEALIDVALQELVRIGTIDPLTFVVHCVSK